MNRKSFLSSIIPLASVATSFNENKLPEKQVLQKQPPHLKKGDTIGITCPSGYISLEECGPAIQKMQEWGFNIRVGHTVGLKNFSLAGTDSERAKELQEMLDDDSIKAIMLARGGYGAVRIIDTINFSHFVKNPKWIIGFSDATVFHCHINSNYGIATIHSKMCNSFPDDFSKASAVQIEAIDSIRKCLVGEKMIYERPVNFENRFGEGTGPLVGGNLSIIEMLDGSVSKLETGGKILFIEDVGEYRYKIDGMLWNLKRSKRLERLKGLIVGEFRIKPDDPGEDFGLSLQNIIMEKVKEFHYPVCFDFPVGHVVENYALKCGAQHRLQVSERATVLEQI